MPKVLCPALIKCVHRLTSCVLCFLISFFNQFTHCWRRKVAISGSELKPRDSPTWDHILKASLPMFTGWTWRCRLGVFLLREPSTFFSCLTGDSEGTCTKLWPNACYINWIHLHHMVLNSITWFCLCTLVVSIKICYNSRIRLSRTEWESITFIFTFPTPLWP